MPQPITITDFSAGELSPRLRGRTDAPIYMKGLETSTNYTSIPFGGLTRRPGSWFVDNISLSDISSSPLFIPFPSNEHDDVELIVYQNTSNDICVVPVIFGTSITLGTKRTLANTFPGVVSADTKWARVDGENKIYCASLKVRPFTISKSSTGADDWTIAWTSYALPAWDAGMYYVKGDVVSYSSTTYVAKENTTDSAANVGITPPSTNYWDTVYSGPTTPDFMVNAATESTDAERSLWYPSAVSVWMGRVIYGGSVKEPLSLWGSGIRQYEFFVLGLNDNSPWKHTLSSTDAGRIQWIVAGDVLALGTPTTDIVIKGNQFGITPSNIQVMTRTSHGSAPIQPILFNEQIIFSKPDRQQIFGMSYLDTLGRYYAQHLTAAADHINKTEVVSWTFVRTPRSSLLMVTGDGRMVQMVYDRAMSQIAFYPWEMTDREIIGVGSLPSGGDEDRIIVVVKDGTTYSVEVFHPIDFYLHESPPFTSTIDYEYGMYLDSAVERTVKQDADGYYVDDLSTWEGESLSSVVDNAPHVPKTVSSGILRLDHSGTNAIVGKNFESVGQSMNIPPSMLMKRINQFGIRFIQTVGGKIGPSYEEMEEMIFRDGEQYYDTALEQFNGDYIIDNVGGFDRSQYIWFSQNIPTPQTILQIIAWIERYE